MQLVEDDALQLSEQKRSIGRGEQKGQLLRRGEQDVRWPLPLAGPGAERRVSGAKFDRDWQSHLLDRSLEVPLDVGGQRLERRQVKRVQVPASPLFLACGGLLGRQFNQARQKPRERLSAACGRDQERGAFFPGFAEKFKLMRVRLPAAAGEPRVERLREGVAGGNCHGNRNRSEPLPPPWR